jgi:hypothetical protein
MPLRVAGTPGLTQPSTGTGRSRTGTHLSTNIYLAVDDGNGPFLVGAVQQITINETRSIKKIPEVGTDGFIDSAPNQSTDINGTCRRTRFDGVRVAQAFRRGFVHVHAQRSPFDIQIYDIIEGDGDRIVITEVKNVWIKSISYSYNADDFVIVDEMGFEAETIISTRGATNSDQNVVDPVFPASINQFERQADRGFGDYRGALDEANLLGAFDGSGA